MGEYWKSNGGKLVLVNQVEGSFGDDYVSGSQSFDDPERMLVYRNDLYGCA